MNVDITVDGYSERLKLFFQRYKAREHY